jgi:hypothetical protein
MADAFGQPLKAAAIVWKLKSDLGEIRLGADELTMAI